MGTGEFGLNAARAYQALPQARRHSETVQYAPTPQQSAFNLFQYVRAFDQDGQPGYSASEIATMSGLDLSGLKDPARIEKLWDRNGDGRVDDQEAFTGMAMLDLADGQFDGRITEAGRTATEDYSLGYSARRQGDMNIADTLTPEMRALLKDVPGSDELLRQHERQLDDRIGPHVERQVEEMQGQYRRNLNDAAIGTQVEERYNAFVEAMKGQ